ncbi:MAG: NAD(P)H-dependent oxidoreductase subunit E [Actinomycetes bacterium]
MSTVEVGEQEEVKTPMAISDETRVQMREIIALYPRSRSAVMPCLHLAQSVEGYVSPEAISVVADELAMSQAEVTAVATFYTMYLRGEAGEYRIGVCINSLCAILGGDDIWESLVDYVGVGSFETTDDGAISLERIECQAACTHAPVMTVNWEFLDNQTPESARSLVDTIRSGGPVGCSRGPKVVQPFSTVGEALAGVDDRLSETDVALDELMLAGLRVARERGHVAPTAPDAKER